MNKDQLIPLFSLGLQGMHEYSIVNPSDILNRSEENRRSRNDLPIVFSEDRGSMPILTTKSNQVDNVYVVANSAAQFMNSSRYPARNIDKGFKKLTDYRYSICRSFNACFFKKGRYFCIHDG